MTLDDLYTQLSFGELRQLFLSGTQIDDPNAGMPQESFVKLLPTVQLGLTELHKRFNLREGRMTLELQDGQTSYVLSTKYAESNTKSSAPVKYIKDAADPFQNDLFKVERIYGTYLEEKYEIPLDEISNPAAIRCTSYNTLLVPTDPEDAPWLSETTELEIVYRANHPEIDKYIAQAAPLATEIYLPPTHIEALCFYIASRVHNPIGMVPGALHEGNNYFQRFLDSVRVLKEHGFELNSEADENTKAYDRGWA